MTTFRSPIMASRDMYLFIWFVRATALAAAGFLTYCIYLDLTHTVDIKAEYAEWTRYYVILLSLCLLIGNLQIMGHFLLYYHKLFLSYYIVGWIVVFGAQFIYFHTVRHVENYAAFILLNVLFFTFHFIITVWSGYM